MAPINQVSSWLYTVASNKMKDSYRKKKMPLPDDIFISFSNEENFDRKEILLPAKSNSETNYLRNIFWDELQQALDELPVN